MSTRACLKKARQWISAGETDAYLAIEKSAVDGIEAVKAFEQLEAIVAPAAAALRVQVERWSATGTDSDGLRAIELARQPGADRSMWDWVHDPATSQAHMLKAFATAIVKVGG